MLFTYGRFLSQQLVNTVTSDKLLYKLVSGFVKYQMFICYFLYIAGIYLFMFYNFLLPISCFLFHRDALVLKYNCLRILLMLFNYCLFMLLCYQVLCGLFWHWRKKCINTNSVNMRGPTWSFSQFSLNPPLLLLTFLKEFSGTFMSFFTILSFTSINILYRPS